MTGIDVTPAVQAAAEALDLAANGSIIQRGYASAFDVRVAVTAALPHLAEGLAWIANPEVSS